MSAQGVGLSGDNRVQITETELDYLESFLEAGDRVGFYVAYYNMTGSAGALLQARVSSFSDVTGGVAFASNFLLQEEFRAAPEGEGQYKGIYALSQDVARQTFAAINANLKETHRTSIIKIANLAILIILGFVSLITKFFH